MSHSRDPAVEPDRGAPAGRAGHDPGRMPYRSCASIELDRPADALPQPQSARGLTAPGELRRSGTGTLSRQQLAAGVEAGDMTGATLPQPGRRLGETAP